MKSNIGVLIRGGGKTVGPSTSLALDGQDRTTKDCELVQQDPSERGFRSYNRMVEVYSSSHGTPKSCLK